MPVKGNTVFCESCNTKLRYDNTSPISMHKSLCFKCENNQEGYEEKKSEPRLVVISGQIDYTKLNTTLSDELYAVAKASVWAKLLNDGNRPKKWLKPRKTGTKVNFVVMQSEEEFDVAFEELQAYVTTVEEKYGVNLRLKKEE